MNPFLSESWLRVMQQSGIVSGIVPIPCGDELIHVGEVRAFGQRRWALFGSWEEGERSGLRELFQQARSAGVCDVECRFNMARWPEEVVLFRGAEVLESFGTYRVELAPGEEALWSGLHQKHRNVIRKAQASGVEVRLGGAWEVFAEAMAASYHKGGRENPFREGYFQALRQNMGERLLLVGAYAEGRFQAGAVIPFDAGRGYYLHGATIPTPSLGAANLLHWEIMRLLRERGVAAYDLGGARRESDDPRLQGIFRFKERFGGVFEPCCHWQRVTHPLRYGMIRAAQGIHAWWQRGGEKR